MSGIGETPVPGRDAMGSNAARDNCEERHQQPRAEGPGMMVSETQLVNALKCEQLLPSNMST